MALRIEIPGWDELTLEHLVLDQNGTLSDRGVLLPEVKERIRALRGLLGVHVLSADTFGTLARVAAELEVTGRRVQTGQEKLQFLTSLGPATCVAIGNGTNDEAMLRAAALGCAVLGPEGASVRALLAGDVVCASIQEALQLLLEPRLLVATLRC